MAWPTVPFHVRARKCPRRLLAPSTRAIKFRDRTARERSELLAPMLATIRRQLRDEWERAFARHTVEPFAADADTVRTVGLFAGGSFAGMPVQFDDRIEEGKAYHIQDFAGPRSGRMILVGIAPKPERTAWAREFATRIVEARARRRRQRARRRSR